MADTTTLAEASQALFCSLADYVLLKREKLDIVFDLDNAPTYAGFKLLWENNKKLTDSIEQVYNNHTDTPQTTLPVLEKFLEKNVDWYESSVLIAKKLVSDIDKVLGKSTGIKKPKATEIWFVRGDDTVMKNIQILFDKANATAKAINKVDDIGAKGIVFGDINKWSPADIYFASDKARDKIQKTVDANSTKTGFIFSSLNILISDLIESGQLLPLSLKKQTKQVTLQKVNFSRQDELKVISKYEYNGTSNWKPYKVNQPQTRDMKIYFNPTSPKDYIKVKHDVSGGAFKCDVVYAGAEARAGSLASIDIFSALVAVIDPKFAIEIKKTFEDGNKKYRKELADWLKKYAGGKKPELEKDSNTGKNKKNPLREAFEKERAELSALNVINKIMPKIKAWLNQDKDRADNFVRIIYEYSTSRTKDSGKFVIAK